MNFEEPKRLSAHVELNNDMWHHGYRSMDGEMVGVSRHCDYQKAVSLGRLRYRVDGILQNGPVRKCTA